MEETEIRVPDEMGEYVGYKVLMASPVLVKHKDSNASVTRVMLVSPMYVKPWPGKGKPLHAKCGIPAAPMHAAPEETCNCGIHAVKTSAQALGIYPMIGLTRDSAEESHMMVIAELALWGKVIKHSEGYRAEYAKPTKLLLFRPKTYTAEDTTAWVVEARYRAKALGDRYGCPVEIEEVKDPLVELQRSTARLDRLDGAFTILGILALIWSAAALGYYLAEGNWILALIQLFPVAVWTNSFRLEAKKRRNKKQEQERKEGEDADS